MGSCCKEEDGDRKERGEINRPLELGSNKAGMPRNRRWKETPRERGMGPSGMNERVQSVRKSMLGLLSRGGIECFSELECTWRSRYA